MSGLTPHPAMWGDQTAAPSLLLALLPHEAWHRLHFLPP